MSDLSDSSVQGEAESFILDAVATRLGVTLLPGGRIVVGGGAHVEVDAQSEDGAVIVEAYARHGALKGAQLKKVAQDVPQVRTLAAHCRVRHGADDSGLREYGGKGLGPWLGRPGGTGLRG